jgi:ATP-dependent Clp protease ATP-binding subunit ClpB
MDTLLVRVDPKKRGEELSRLLSRLEFRIIGQDRALQKIARVLQKFAVGLNAPNRPLAVLLFLGPSGVGKTEVSHALADILLNNRDALTRVDCAEFQESHEVSKLIGSPPGYLGHLSNNARLSQARLDQYQTETTKINILTFDEIEKADEAVTDFLLGVLDRGKATLGNGEVVDFTKTIIVITSNLGSREVSNLIHGSEIGFRSNTEAREDLDAKIYKTAKEAAKRHFRPEFINRLDRIIVFRSLSEESLRRILHKELSQLRGRIPDHHAVKLDLSNRAKTFLLKQGTSDAYGARELQRTVERYVADPLANLLGSGQLDVGDRVLIDFEDGEMTFDRLSLS